MATLLHLDSSLNGDQSVSRAVTASFRAAWQDEHPDGTVVYRDLAADPPPHLEAAVLAAGAVPPAERTAEQRQAAALREELIQELEAADAVLVGAPMYNYMISSPLKAWLDHVMVVGRTTGDTATAAGTPLTVVASRGGSYRAGTPREGADFAVPYVRHAFAQLGMVAEFVIPELTLAHSNPAMADLTELADASRAQAHQEAAERGRKLAADLGGTSV